MRSRAEIKFKTGYTDNISKRPSVNVDAAVPGAVQLDWANAHDWPPYYIGNNFEQYKWMEDVYWVYSAELDLSHDTDEKIYLCSKGIDYKYDVILNSKIIHSHEGMYTPFEIDLTDHPEKSLLEIVIHPVPKAEGEPEGRRQARRSCKPPVSYGWDFHPRLIPSGIWEDIYLEKRNHLNILEYSFTYELDETYTNAQFSIDFTASEKNFEYNVRITDGEEREVFKETGYQKGSKCRICSVLNDVDLWWPIGYGKQPVYQVYIETMRNGLVTDRAVLRSGFRKFDLVMNEGAWDKPDKMPKTRSEPPAQLQINGKKIFCKGANWITPDIFYGTINKEKYLDLLDLAVKANFNIIRVWGGGIVNKDSFYSICDKMGLMVWQEFPLACNDYPDDKKYLQVLDKESVSIIKRLRQHPSLAIWCSGNELFNEWSGMTDQSHAIRLLDRNCFELDKNTPFLSTSPLMGMAHGGYLFYDSNTGEDVIETINGSDNTAYPEFACPSIADLDILEEVIPGEMPDRIGQDGPWISHHATDAFVPTGWGMPEVLERFFGCPVSLEEQISQSRLLQSQGLKAIYEEARRKQPRASMALSWCFAECWPVAAGTSIVDWKSRPKESYYAVKESLRPILASIRLKKFMWTTRENIEAEIWILNDSEKTLEAGKITVHFIGEKASIASDSWEAGEVQAYSNSKGPAISCKASDLGEGLVKIRISSDISAGYDSEYFLVIKDEGR